MIEDIFLCVIIYNICIGKNSIKIVEILVDFIVFFIKLIIYIYNLLIY